MLRSVTDGLSAKRTTEHRRVWSAPLVGKAISSFCSCRLYSSLNSKHERVPSKWLILPGRILYPGVVACAQGVPMLVLHQPVPQPRDVVKLSVMDRKKSRESQHNTGCVVCCVRQTCSAMNDPGVVMGWERSSPTCHLTLFKSWHYLPLSSFQMPEKPK